MAAVQTNFLVNGISGMLGNMIFKNLRGKTIVTKVPQRPQRQSEQQKANRSKFKEASAWAKEVLRDAARKAYYQQKAKKLKLPNAYTAAITDYMRRPQLQIVDNADKSRTCYVRKKQFELARVEVRVRPAPHEKEQVHEVKKSHSNEWVFHLSKEERMHDVCIRMTDTAGVVQVMRLFPV